MPPTALTAPTTNTSAHDTVGTDEDPPRLDIYIFEEIKDLMSKAKQYEQDEKECKRKVEKYNRSIEAAEEMIAKAQKKKEALVKRNEFLKDCLEKMEERKRQALRYWEDYGIEVKQVSTDEDSFQQYEFNYMKLPMPTNQCSINIRYQDKRLEVVEQLPEILITDQLNELNARLTNNCVNARNGAVDYRLAMILIKKELVKKLTRLPCKNL